MPEQRTSSALRQASELLADTQAASCGELQLSLGATQPPSWRIAASICCISSGNSGICRARLGHA